MLPPLYEFPLKTLSLQNCQIFQTFDKSSTTIFFLVQPLDLCVFISSTSFSQSLPKTTSEFNLFSFFIPHPPSFLIKLLPWRPLKLRFCSQPSKVASPEMFSPNREIADPVLFMLSWVLCFLGNRPLSSAESSQRSAPEGKKLSPSPQISDVSDPDLG